MKEDNTLKIELEFTAELYTYFMENLKEHYEIELLQGKQRPLENGMTRINFELTGWKADMFKDMMRMLMSLPSDKIKVKFFGQDINPN